MVRKSKIKEIPTARQLQKALNCVFESNSWLEKRPGYWSEKTLDYLFSLCYCEHVNTNKLNDCKLCRLKFNCYTRFKLNSPIV